MMFLDLCNTTVCLNPIKGQSVIVWKNVKRCLEAQLFPEKNGKDDGTDMASWLRHSDAILKRFWCDETHLWI
jgi:hypothetical protein